MRFLSLVGLVLWLGGQALNMGNLTTLTVFIVILNVLMWFASIGMTEANPGGVGCYNVEGTIIANVNNQQNNFTVGENPIGSLPESQTGFVSEGNTNIFTDIFNNIVGWFKTAPGLKYIYAVVAAPYNVLACMGAPWQFVAGLGTFWYVTTFLVMISYLWGRD